MAHKRPELIFFMPMMALIQRGMAAENKKGCSPSI